MTDDLTEEAEIETPEPDAVASEAVADDETFTATLGDDEPPEDEPEDTPVLRNVRKLLRETQKKTRELERALAAKEQPAPAEEALPAKPTLETAGYDEDKFEADLLAWNAKKAKAEAAAEAKRKEAEEADKSWKDRMTGYEAEKAKIAADDVDEAEATAKELFSITQQGIIVAGAKRPAALVYALGKNPEKAKELAAIKDPVKFAFAIAEVQSQMKIAPTKPPAPEARVSAGARIPGSSNAELDRLRAQAEKTGDMTPVIAYKRKMAAKG